jgi:hypothetical protein
MWDLGLRRREHPCDDGRTWVSHLRSPTDSAAVAARYLLCGQVVAAAVALDHRWNVELRTSPAMRSSRSIEAKLLLIGSTGSCRRPTVLNESSVLTRWASGSEHLAGRTRGPVGGALW